MSEKLSTDAFFFQACKTLQENFLRWSGVLLQVCILSRDQAWSEHVNGNFEIVHNEADGNLRCSFLNILNNFEQFEQYRLKIQTRVSRIVKDTN